MLPTFAPTFWNPAPALEESSQFVEESNYIDRLHAHHWRPMRANRMKKKAKKKKLPSRERLGALGFEVQEDRFFYYLQRSWFGLPGFCRQRLQGRLPLHSEPSCRAPPSPRVWASSPLHEYSLCQLVSSLPRSAWASPQDPDWKPRSAWSSLYASHLCSDLSIIHTTRAAINFRMKIQWRHKNAWRAQGGFKGTDSSSTFSEMDLGFQALPPAPPGMTSSPLRALLSSSSLSSGVSIITASRMFSLSTSLISSTMSLSFSTGSRLEAKISLIFAS